MIRTSIFALFLAACAGGTSEETPQAPAPAAAEEVVTYECPMHPQITSTNAEDKCSICGMDLVAQEAHDHSAHEH
jgi:hypothetical protein